MPTVDEPRGGQADPAHESHDRGRRLDSWQEIAAYLNRDLRTLQRWEKSANLPIRRLNGPGMRAVFAYTADLDEWLRQQSPSPADVPRDAQPIALVSTTSTPPANRASRHTIAAAAAVLLALAGLVAWIVAHRARPSFEVLSARPLTSEVGSERDPDISPDGKAIAYVSAAPNQRGRIHIRMIDGGASHPLTDSPANESSPVWSPDGARLAFLRGNPTDTVTVFTASRLGGDERTLADVRPYPSRRANVIGHLLAWTPDGTHVIAPDRATGDNGPLILIETQTGARRPLTTPAPGQFDVEPTLSSDGRLLLFNRVRGEFQSDVFVQRLDAAYAPVGEARRLRSTAQWNGTPRLIEARGEVLTSAGSVPRLSLWRQPLDGAAPPVSLGIFGDYAMQSAVHQGIGRIVAATFRDQSDVLRFALPEAPAKDAVDPPVQGFLESTFVDRGPAYTVDGSRIAFISDRTGRPHLWVANAAGEGATEWAQAFEANPPPPTWSPDGSHVAFTGVGPAGTFQLFVVDATTRVARQVTQDALEVGHAEWSPDGRFLYASAAEKGAFGIYRVPAAGGIAELVLPGYRAVRGMDPAGAGLYVTRTNARNQSDLFYVPLPNGAPVAVATMNFAEDAWVTPKGVYYMARPADGTPPRLSVYFRTHEGVVSLVQAYTRPPGRGLSVSADGRYALTTRVAPPISDLLLLETSK